MYKPFTLLVMQCSLRVLINILDSSGNKWR